MTRPFERIFFTFLLVACSGCLQTAVPKTSDVMLRLPTLDDRPETFRCGYYAGRQIIKFYHPQVAEEDIRTESLLFSKADDTVSILYFVKDNVRIPLRIKSSNLSELISSVSAGDPVLVFMPLGAIETMHFGVLGTEVLHSITVAGHSADKTKLFFYSNGKGPFVTSREVFAEQWARVDNLCIMRDR